MQWPFLLTAVLLIVFVSLSPLLTADFVDIDDSKLILEKQNDFQQAPGKIFKYSRETPHYKPFTYLTWLIEYYLSGNAAWMHHLNNLLLHLLNCVLVFMLVLKISDRFAFTKQITMPLALLCALFFGIHPMHVESVAWAVERKDVLYVATFLLSLWCYLKYIEGKRFLWLALSVGSFLLSVFSKSPAVVLPFVLFLLDWTYGRKFSFRLLREKGLHFAVLLIALYMFGFFSLDTTEGSVGAVAEQEIMSKAENVKHLPTLYAKLAIGSMQAVLWYLHSWIPAKLSLAYPREQLIGSFGAAIHIFPWIIAAAAGLLWWKRRKWPFALFCHVFFFLALLPAVIRVSPGVGIFLNDRYAYLALFGIILFALAWILHLKNRKLAYGIIAFLAIIFSIQSFTISKNWKNAKTLWTSVINKYPSVAYAYTNRGSFYRKEGEMDKALNDLNTAVSIDADANNLNQRGVILRAMGKPAEAIEDYTRAIEDDPENDQAWLNRGNAYLDIGRRQQALNDLNKAVDLNPRSAKAWTNRGVAFAQMGQWQQAMDNFANAQELDHHYPDIYLNRGIMYFQMNQPAQAISDFKQYLEYHPEDHQIWFDIGNIYQNTGDHRNAIEYYTQAIALYPDRRYFQKRATSHQALGNTEAAVRDKNAAGG